MLAVRSVLEPRQFHYEALWKSLQSALEKFQLDSVVGCSLGAPWVLLEESQSVIGAPGAHFWGVTTLQMGTTTIALVVVTHVTLSLPTF